MNYSLSIDFFDRLDVKVLNEEIIICKLVFLNEQYILLHTYTLQHDPILHFCVKFLNQTMLN